MYDNILLHTAYTPDIAPPDYHLFRALQNNLISKTLKSLDDAKKHFKQFFAKKFQELYEREVMELPNRHYLLLLTEQNGEYITELINFSVRKFLV